MVINVNVAVISGSQENIPKRNPKFALSASLHTGIYLVKRISGSSVAYSKV